VVKYTPIDDKPLKLEYKTMMENLSKLAGKKDAAADVESQINTVVSLANEKSKEIITGNENELK
jgi:hypothetical protein